MRVSDLRTILADMDGSIDLLAHATHGDCKFRFFDIEAVAVERAVRSRDDAGLAHAEFDEVNGRPLAVLTLTSEF
jgi:hypothetical protein